MLAPISGITIVLNQKSFFRAGGSAVVAFAVAVLLLVTVAPGLLPGTVREVRAQAPAAAPAAKELPNGSIPVVVSKQTTRFTEPLHSDGTVNYVEALNRKNARDVTPETNAAVVLCEVMGPAMLPKEVRERCLTALGVKLPENAGGFVSFEDFARQQAQSQGLKDKALDDAVKTAMRDYYELQGMPWDKGRSPVVAAWLEANGKHLDKLVEAANRPHFYMPLLTTSDPPRLMEVLMPWVGPVGDVARALCLRATYRLQGKDPAGARTDVIAAACWARLLSQQRTMMTLMVGIGCEVAAYDTCQAMARSGQLSAADIRVLLGELQALTSRPLVVDAVDEFARCTSLDVLMQFQRNGTFAALYELTGATQTVGSTPPEQPKGPDASLPMVLDYPVVMQALNTRYDELVAMLRIPEYAEFKAAEQDYNKRFTAWLMANNHFTVDYLNPQTWDRYRAMSAQEKRQFLTPGMSVIVPKSIIGAFLGVRTQEEFARTQLGLTRVALALAAYHAENKSYPERLDQLQPKHLPGVPPDRFAGKPFTYRREGTGCVVYSVGRDMTDDGGDPKKDLVVRLGN